MADYIVKSGGTATGNVGRYTTPQSGSFATLGAANYYGNIVAAIAATTVPVAGDRILVSDLHDFSTSSAIDYNGVGLGKYFIICVDDNLMENGRTDGNRSNEFSTGTADVSIRNQFISGVHIRSADNIEYRNTCRLEDCVIEPTGNTDLVNSLEDGADITLLNSDILLHGVNSSISVTNGASFTMFGGSIQNTTAGSAIFAASPSNGGAHYMLTGVDLSDVTGTVFANMGNDPTNDDVIFGRLHRCKLGVGVTKVAQLFTSYDHCIIFTECSDSDAEAPYQYYQRSFGGDVEDDTTIYRAEDDTYSDGTSVSYKITTDANASLGMPCRFEFPQERWNELSNSSEDILTLHLASTDVLTDKDVYITVYFADGTNYTTTNVLTSAPTLSYTGTLNLMATATNLTTDSGSDWRDGVGALTGHNEYEISIDTSATGADCVVRVIVNVTKPSTIIQLASTVEAS